MKRLRQEQTWKGRDNRYCGCCEGDFNHNPISISLVIVQNLTEDIPTRWRDLLFYIKKGCKLEFPFRCGGNKKWFYKVHVWNIILYETKEEKTQNKNSHLREKGPLAFCKIKTWNQKKKRNLGPSFLKPLTNSFKYIFEVTFIFQHNNIYLQV